MKMCKFYRFLYSILPFKTIRADLIRRHFGVCEDCRENFQLKEPLNEVKAIKAWAQGQASLWPVVEAGLQTPDKAKAEPKKTIIFHPFRIWRWVAGFITLTVLVAIGFLIQREAKKEIPSEKVLLAKSPPKVIIKRAELKGIKAKPIIYQTPTVSIILFVEDKESGGLDE
jgi:hypothetical protein